MKSRKTMLIIFSIIVSISIAYFVQSKGNVDNDILEKANKRFENSIVLYVGSPAAYANNEKIKIDEKDEEIYPIIKNDRTIVPVRFISEKLGAKVYWDQNSRTATLNLNNKEIKLTLDSDVMKVDDLEVKLDAQPEIKNGRMFIPLRAISEAYGKKVFWNNGLIIISDKDNIVDVEADSEIIDEIISRVNVLPSVNSFENLQKLLEKAEKNNINVYNRGLMIEDMAMDVLNAEKTVESVDSANQKQMASEDHSTTNVQVQGVDEADIVKNDGQFIYHVNNSKINIFKAYPANEMNLISSLDFKEKGFSPREIYVDSNKLVVIGSAYNDIYHTMEKRKMSQEMIAPDIYYPRNTTKAIIYDITDKKVVKQLREVEVDGYYISSRKVDSSLYLVTNKHAYYNILREQDGIVPMYRDTAVKDDFENVDYKDIKYLPNFVEPNYLIIAGIDIESNKEAEISTYLGAGNNVYASRENLYIATVNYNYQEPAIKTMSKFIAPVYNPNTLVYKFGLNDGNVAYKGKGEVPGTILNQFSMDEYDEHFRIATTTGQPWRSGEFTSANNVYILDKNMSIVGKLEDLAPGERIYSVRFMGDRGYVVTFKTVDPLFVIDLNEPKSPKVLGELKIPGFSDYLHPYDENHIIGFGKDTMEIPVKDKYGFITDTRAITIGMKLAVFDVSDVSNPIQKHVEKIGGRGTHSEMLHNHKALLFSKAKNLLAFPISVAEEKVDSDGIPQYGQPVFVGAYIYNIDLENGFKLKGKVSHYDDIKDSKYDNERYYYDYKGQIQRIMYIDDTLYTISPSMLKANDLSSLVEINKVEVK